MTITSVTLPISLQPAYNESEKVIRIHSKTFYMASSLMPFEQRLAIRALYGFCRVTDDMVDRQGATLNEVEAWRARVLAPLGDSDPAVLKVWKWTRQQYSIDSRYESELIDGVCMDLERRSYETWEQLQKYCYGVASTVGLLSTPIIGLVEGITFEKAAPYAIKLGIALQLTNILRDVGEDARLGRVYLPNEDLKTFGLTQADIFNGVADGRFIHLMQFEIARARRLYEEAWPGIGMLDRSGRVAVGAAAIFYKAILEEIEAIQYQVYRLRASTSKWRKLALLPEILLRTWNTNVN
jgi:15-cis-phytoene synthase